MNDSTNAKARIQLTHQEIEAIRNLARANLRGKVCRKVPDETLGALLIKVARVSKRVEALA